MPPPIQLLSVAPQTTAVIRDRVTPRELPRFVPAACGEVWTFMRSSGQPKPGRNVALYFGDGQVEVGVEAAAFTGNGRVICSQIPGGLVATAPHFGPYPTMGSTHRALREWCTEHGHRLTGTSWELYGHWQREWDSNPAQIRTDIYYLVEAETSTA